MTDIEPATVPGDRLPPPADTSMWLSHHWPSGYDRCALIGGLHVCRRCVVLYPLAAVAALVIGFGATWPERLDVWLCWLLPLPAVVEFVGEHMGRVRYLLGRQIATTALLAIACGRLYVRYLDDGRDVLVWSVAVVYGGLCLGAVLLHAFRPPSSDV